MSKNTFLMLVSLSLLSLVFSCKKESQLPPEDLGYSYFPYQPGDYLIYQVDSTYYNDFFDTVYHSIFKIKEYYESYFYDQQGRLSIRIERWYQWNDTADWVLRDVWYSCLTPSYAERFEENVRLTKLVFPVRSSSEWNGNAFNIFDEEVYEYDEIDEAFLVGSFSFDSTLIVQHAPTPNLIAEVNKTEVYARHVGLVYKYFLDIGKNYVSGEIESGTEYSWTLLEYGVE